MENYKSEKTGMNIEDGRNGFLSSKEMDEFRKAELKRVLNQDPTEKASLKMDKNIHLAQEILPEGVFEGDYQRAVLDAYNQIVKLLKEQFEAKQKKAKEQYTPADGWKKIYDISLKNQGQVINFLFQEPFFTQIPTARSYFKKIPNQEAFSTNVNDQIFNLIGSGNVDTTQEGIIIAKSGAFQETVFFADSRYIKELLLMFQEDGKGVYDDRIGEMVGYEHPLLFHETLQNQNGRGSMIPIRLVEFGKPQVIKPEDLGVLAQHSLDIESFFTHEDDIRFN